MSTSTDPVLRSWTILAATLMMGTGLITALGIVMAQPTENWVLPVGVVAAVAVACAWGAHQIGYRMPAVTADDAAAARQASVRAYQSAFMLRYSFASAPALVGLALALSLGGTAPALLGGVVSVGLEYFHCWPRRALLERCREILERDGGRSHLPGL